MELTLGEVGDDVIAYKLWAAMSRRGSIRLELLELDQRRVAREMVRRGLVVSVGNVLVQALNAPLERWEGLA